MFSASKKALQDALGMIAATHRALAIVEFSLDGMVLDANQNFLNIFGYALAEIRGKHHSMFVDPGERDDDEYHAFWASLKGGESHANEYKRVGKDGRSVWIQASYNPVFDEDVKPIKVVTFATNIGSQKLKSMEDAGKLAAMSCAQAVIEFKMDGTIITANEKFLNALGYSLPEIQGKHHSMFVDAVERDSSAYREFWNRLNRAEYQAAEFRRIGKGGREVWILATYNPILDETGKPFKVVKLATDVTVQKMRSADYSSQVDAIQKSQAVIEFNMDGTIISANEKFLGALGYAIDEIRGKHHSMFVDPSERAAPSYKEFWKRLGRGQYDTGEYRRIGKGGKEVWIQASYNPILDLNGRPFKVVKYASDVTAQAVARQKSERARALIEAVAAGSEQMSASIREIAETMIKSRQSATTAVSQVEAADRQTQRLSAAAQSMGGIVGLISDITGQINLLALNATIESARAGDAGRGFAVVASEVKNLATQAKQATEKIGAEIQALNCVSSDVVAALSAIRMSIDHVNDYVTSTAAAVEEQSTVTSDMSSNMQRAAAELA